MKDDQDIYDGVLQFAGPDERWVVVHTRPRCEKKVTCYCEEKGILVYVPIRKTVHRYGGRIRTFYPVLFPGYVFCRMRTPQWPGIRQNQNVANLLEVIDQATLTQQLRHIERALGEGDDVEVMPFLEAGRTVLVKAGPLRGMEGIVQRVRDRTRVVLNVDMIQQAVSIEIDSALLAPT